MTTTPTPSPARRAAEKIDDYCFGHGQVPASINEHTPPVEIIESLITAELAVERAEIRRVLEDCQTITQRMVNENSIELLALRAILIRQLTTLLSKLEAGK